MKKLSKRWLSEKRENLLFGNTGLAGPGGAVGGIIASDCGRALGPVEETEVLEGVAKDRPWTGGTPVPKGQLQIRSCMGRGGRRWGGGRGLPCLSESQDRVRVQEG